MKILPFLAFIILSCNTTRNSRVDDGSQPMSENRMEGVVHLTDECGVGVDVIQGDVMRTYQPTFLDENLRVEGMRIRFTLKVTNGKPPAACPNYIVAEFSEVTALRS